MKITKDLQNYLEIVSIIIQTNGMDYLCYLSRYNDGLLTFQIASPIHLNRNEKISLQFNFKTATETILVNLIDYGVNFIQVKLHPTSLQNISKCIKKIDEMDKNDEKYGRRREARIKLGIVHYEKFLLENKEQVLIYKSFQLMQPCVLMDVSMHGLCILTPYSIEMNKIDNYRIKVKFVNPEESIIVDVHKVHINIKVDNNKKYAIISCQLLEPIHFVWKKRIIDLNKKKGEL